jgi:putative transposase
MKKAITSTAIPTHALKSEALAGMTASFERFCLAAGIETLSEMMEQDAEAICGSRHARGEGRQAHRWGRTKGKIGFHGGKVDVERPRVRGLEGEERILPSWKSAVGENWLGEWAMNQMLIAVSTRKFERSVRLPGGDVPVPQGAGLSKSATSRRFVALSAARMRQWMATRLDHLDLMVIQIDGVHMADDMLLVAAIGIDATGEKHPLGLVEGATENAATARALIANLVDRGLDPAVPRLFIIDGSKALSTAIRRAFGRDAPIQRCQVHKARNILERLPKSMHASVRSVLRQVWELDDAAKAEKLLRNLARRLEADWDGVAGSILEGLDEMLTVTRLGLPRELRRSLACTNIIENVMGTVRRVCRNVKHWRSPSMAMRWTAAAMIEAKNGFRRLKAHKQLPALRAALDRKKAAAAEPPLAQIDEAA